MPKKKKKMFKDLHERWKELDLPEEYEEILEEIEQEIVGIKQEMSIKVILDKIRKDLANSELWFKLGIVLSNAGKYDFALAALDITEKLEPEKKYLNGVKGYILSKLGENRDAKKFLKKAILETGQITGYKTLDGMVKGIKAGNIEL